MDVLLVNLIKKRAGALNSEASFIYYGGQESNKTLPTKVVLGTMQYNYHAAYAQGEQLVTSWGNKASVQPNPLPAISEVIAITNAVVGDVYNVEAEFSVGGKKYPAGTNVACIKNTSTTEHTEANWDPLGGTVDLSAYATKAEMNSGLNSKINTSAIKNDLTTGGVTNVLSAEQGKILKRMIDQATAGGGIIIE